MYPGSTNVKKKCISSYIDVNLLNFLLFSVSKVNISGFFANVQRKLHIWISQLDIWKILIDYNFMFYEPKY